VIRYLLDTNTVSHVLKGHPAVAQRVVAVPLPTVCISSITAGELAYGVAKRPLSASRNAAVTEFLRRVAILPWDEAAARRYGVMRAELEREGKGLGPLDLLIAAHALAVGAVLVTNDQAFSGVAGLHTEDWTVPA
jgi:tRNA(fMet)-specific endonuclease VapC